MNSKIITLIAALGGVICVNANAQQAGQPANTVRMDNGVVVSNAQITRNQDGVNVQMDLDFTDIKVKSDREVHVIPSLVGQQDTLMLAHLNVLGRNRYFYHLRNKLEMKVSDKDQAWRKKDVPDTVHFDMTVPYEPWMNGARVMVNECLLGCCSKVLEDNWNETNVAYTVPVMPVFVPSFVFLRPKADLRKMRSLSAVSYVDFPVSKTDIYPQYRNNPRELAKIVATIDSVRNDSDVTIKAIFLKGYASPESPYENNTRLAKGRTNSIKKYLSNFSHLPLSVIETDYEPENWAGLREYVVNSNISNKEGILKIIDTQMLGPDPKEDYLKQQYPTEYAFLKENCYPALRKVDYQISYEVRVFTSVEEIRKAYAQDPGKLSLDEFYLLALSYPEDSAEFHDVIRTAVNFYPKDQVANLNAANVAMMEGRMKDAGAYLDKAGDSYEAAYARGLYNAMTGEYQRAADYLGKIKADLPAATQAYDQVQNMLEIKALLFDKK